MMSDKKSYWIFFFVSYTLFYPDFCIANQLLKTKQQLAQLSKQIHHTKKSLTVAKQKRMSLQAGLAIQDKKIGQLLIQKKKLAHQIKQNNKAIIKLGMQVNVLNDQIQQEKKKLSQHVYSRYMIDIHQPIKWLFFPGSKHELSQILTYYQYIINAQQKYIQSIGIKTEKLKIKKNEINDRIVRDKNLRKFLAQKQSSIELSKHKQQLIIQQLNKIIISNAQKLKEFQENQIELSRIFTQLSKKKRISQNRPFASRRNHLPRPVSVGIKSIKQMHQGLQFFAPEGTSVKSIHPGKILFCDWLKGYGLLIIIDHGKGYMTLYAHNQELTKKKGDWVLAGEKIAEVGHTGGLRENGLYFEIRHHGKAISPINWLS